MSAIMVMSAGLVWTSLWTQPGSCDARTAVTGAPRLWRPVSGQFIYVRVAMMRWLGWFYWWRSIVRQRPVAPIQALQWANHSIHQPYRSQLFDQPLTNPIDFDLIVCQNLTIWKQVTTRFVNDHGNSVICVSVFCQPPNTWNIEVVL